MADRDDDRVRLEYETAGVGRRRSVRVATAAVGASSATMAAVVKRVEG